MSAVRKLTSFAQDSDHIRFGALPELKVLRGGKTSRVAGLKSPLRGGSALGFIVVCGLVLIMALAGVLVLNTAVVNRSYEMARLQTKVQVLSQDVQSKQDQIRRAQAQLPQRASELGMVGIDSVEVVDVSKYAAKIANVMNGSTGARG